MAILDLISHVHLPSYVYHPRRDIFSCSCLFAIFFMSCALFYVPINSSLFFNSIFLRLFPYIFILCFNFVLFVYCSPYCFSPCIDIVVYFLFVYNFTDCSHQVETQMQLINIISYLQFNLHISNCMNHILGPGVALLRRYATSRTVPGSIPGGVTAFFRDIFIPTVPWPRVRLSP